LARSLALGNRNTSLKEQPAELIHQSCLLLYQPRPHPVERLQVKLLSIL
jgi:hypothetical protein